MGLGQRWLKQQSVAKALTCMVASCLPCATSSLSLPSARAERCHATQLNVLHAMLHTERGSAHHGIHNGVLCRGQLAMHVVAQTRLHAAKLLSLCAQAIPTQRIVSGSSQPTHHGCVLVLGLLLGQLGAERGSDVLLQLTAPHGQPLGRFVCNRERVNRRHLRLRERVRARRPPGCFCGESPTKVRLTTPSDGSITRSPSGTGRIVCGRQTGPTGQHTSRRLDSQQQRPPHRVPAAVVRNEVLARLKRRLAVHAKLQRKQTQHDAWRALNTWPHMSGARLVRACPESAQACTPSDHRRQ